MHGDVKSLLLPPTRLVCVPCGRPLSTCICSCDELQASVMWDVRGALIDGKRP
jgi:hypothetical protein